MPDHHSVNGANDMRAFDNALFRAAMSDLWDYDGDGAVPESKVSGDGEDGDDGPALPDCLSPCVVRNIHFNCHGALYCEMMG